MKRLALLLLGVVMVAGLAGCSGGGGSEPTGSTTDITGRWSIEVNNDGHPFFINLSQDADGDISGTREGAADWAYFGKRQGNTSNYELHATYYNGYYTRAEFDANIVLRGGTFDGELIAHNGWRAPWKGKRA